MSFFSLTGSGFNNVTHRPQPSSWHWRWRLCVHSRALRLGDLVMSCHVKCQMSLLLLPARPPHKRKYNQQSTTNETALTAASTGLAMMMMCDNISDKLIPIMHWVSWSFHAMLCYTMLCDAMHMHSSQAEIPRVICMCMYGVYKC